jgi:molecular chaperone GrpE
MTRKKVESEEAFATNENNSEQGIGPEETKDDKDHPSSKKTKREKKVENELAGLKLKYEDLNDKYLRLFSDFDNYRKRSLKEKIELSKTASEEVIVELLGVIDDFERALQALEKDSPSFEGLNLIYNKLLKILKQKGLQEIEAKGTEFDTDYHEALTNVPAPEEQLKGKVIEVIQKGYTLSGKVIRYAKVVVGA